MTIRYCADLFYCRRDKKKKIPQKVYTWWRIEEAMQKWKLLLKELRTLH